MWYRLAWATGRRLSWGQGSNYVIVAVCFANGENSAKREGGMGACQVTDHVALKQQPKKSYRQTGAASSMGQLSLTSGSVCDNSTVDGWLFHRIISCATAK
jgi:hypothetical protein